jgi:hypothetical protein
MAKDYDKTTQLNRDIGRFSITWWSLFQGLPDGFSRQEGFTLPAILPLS